MATDDQTQANAAPTAPASGGVKPVLGLFDNENELRDYLAKHLDLIEQGLTLIQANYAVQTPKGAAGALDILAKDKYGSFVIIEVKRSEVAARQALHELSKYLTGFMTSQHVDEHKLRCFVVSTTWHELDSPLAYFRSAVSVDVKGFEVSARGGKISVSERQLPSISSLPKLCPDTRLIQPSQGHPISAVVAELRQELGKLPVVRAALLQFAPDARGDTLAVLCLWRIPDGALAEVREVTKSLVSQWEDSSEEWSEESRVLDWLISRCASIAPNLATLQRGTPEKIANILEARPFRELVQLGAWPKQDLVHDLAEMQRCVVAKDVSVTGRRANRYSFSSRSSPRTGPSWDYASSAFLAFLAFEPHWQSEVARFLAGVPKSSDVEFVAQDCRHFQFRVYQHLHDSRAQLTRFGLKVTDERGVTTHNVYGGWAWDGRTCPKDARAQLVETYGSLDNARIAVLSSTDPRRYESAFRAHGFHPFVVEVDNRTNRGNLYLCEPCPRNLNKDCGLEQFVTANAQYCQELAEVFSPIPPVPSGSRGPVLFELTSR